MDIQKIDFVGGYRWEAIKVSPDSGEMYGGFMLPDGSILCIMYQKEALAFAETLTKHMSPAVSVEAENLSTRCAELFSTLRHSTPLEDIANRLDPILQNALDEAKHEAVEEFKSTELLTDKSCIVRFHTPMHKSMMDEFYRVVDDLKMGACIVDLWLYDLHRMFKRHGYELQIREIVGE